MSGASGLNSKSIVDASQAESGSAAASLLRSERRDFDNFSVFSDSALSLATTGVGKSELFQLDAAH